MADTTHPPTQSDTRPATRTLLGEGTSFRAQATEAVGAEKGRWGRLSHPRFIVLHCGAPVTAVIRCFTAVLLLISVPATCAQRALSLPANNRKDTPKVITAAALSGEERGPSEAYSIQPRDIPFLQKKGEWQCQGHGISIMATGEPKSGTTWLGRLMPQLALELCGSPTNPWCEMGGLVVHPNEPSPWYEFEMLNAGGGTGGNAALFLHYKGFPKHFIPGMALAEPRHGCTNGGRRHRSFFEDDPPCISGGAPTRERLRACLWDTSERCLGQASKDFRRTAVIFRDPRDVVISELRMRRDFYHQPELESVSLDDFVHRRFETLVSWTHQRWVWHVETVMSENSHVMFYDDMKANHLGMIELAAFMGLSCSADQALQVWESHQSSSSNSDYTTYGLPAETIGWMNTTMARLLPPVASLHWGLTPTDV
ncbi:unnamed protein product [Pylaiella littoralis]